MRINGSIVEDTYAEAFRMRCVRAIITADDPHWVEAASRAFTGYGSLIIGCDAEAGVERTLGPAETPDGRPGASALLFGLAADGVGRALRRRAGQCLMTCATVAAYDGFPDAEERVPFGKRLRYFGDGFQKSKVIGGKRYWRVPVMDGEFLIEDSAGVVQGVAGGNIIVQGGTRKAALDAARRAADAVAAAPGAIAPFPGGVVRSGSKVGSRYRTLRASTNDAFCPTLRGRAAETRLHPEATCAYEVVIDGINEKAVATAMRQAVLAAAGPGIPQISAGNYGGKLGEFLIRLREVLR
jgi:formylmethanofuran--tetrahydromethanopterin N-formyltransferase